MPAESGGGFKGSAREMGWWERVRKGVGGTIRLVGSAAGFIAKINCIIDKIEGLIDAANAAGEGDLASAGLALAGAARSACFTPDTLVSLADGTQVPIAEIEALDVVTCLDEEAGSSVDPALGSPFPDHYDQVDPAT